MEGGIVNRENKEIAQRLFSFLEKFGEIFFPILDFLVMISDDHKKGFELVWKFQDVVNTSNVKKSNIKILGVRITPRAWDDGNRIISVHIKFIMEGGDRRDTKPYEDTIGSVDRYGNSSPCSAYFFDNDVFEEILHKLTTEKTALTELLRHVYESSNIFR